MHVGIMRSPKVKTAPLLFEVLEVLFFSNSLLRIGVGQLSLSCYGGRVSPAPLGSSWRSRSGGWGACPAPARSPSPRSRRGLHAKLGPDCPAPGTPCSV